MSHSLADIVAALGGELHGDAQYRVSHIASIERADAQCISFIASRKFETYLTSTLAGCLIVSPHLLVQAKNRGNCIVSADPYVYYAKLSQWWQEQSQAQALVGSSGATVGIHPSSVVDASAQIHPSASIGPLCIIGAHAQVGANTVLKGAVTLGEHCQIGKRCIVHAGVRIGADGFGFAKVATPQGHQWEKIAQLAAVRIGDDVEIGANTTIDRGALHDTVIEDGVKLDNQIQIGHNVHIGRHTLISACCGVAGSAKIGAYCTIAGGCMIGGHLHICDNVTIGAVSVVIASIDTPGHYTGFYPLDKHQNWEKSAAIVKNLPEIRQRLRALENLR